MIGLGGEPQTGWIGLVAKLIELFCRLDGEQLLTAAFGPSDGRIETGENSLRFRRTGGAGSLGLTILPSIPC